MRRVGKIIFAMDIVLVLPLAASRTANVIMRT